MEYLNVNIQTTKTQSAAMKSAHRPFLAFVVITVIVLYSLMAIIGS
jgi:hypothetical protein